jgi:plastocyanin
VRAISLLVAALVFGVLSACGGDNNKNNSTTTSTTPTTPTQNVNNKGSENFAGKSSGEVELDNFYFKPTVVQGKAGQSLTLELKNEGDVEHNFTLTDQNIDTDLEPGKSAKVKVTIPKSGTVSFFCKYHKSMGMAGSLAVASASGGGSSSSSSGGSSSSGSSSSSGNSSSGSSSGGGGY